MVRRETRRPLQEGRTRIVRQQVLDDAKDPRTWDEEQRWSVIKIEELRRSVGGYSSKKLRRMLKYYRAFKMRKHRNVVVDELERRRGE